MNDEIYAECLVKRKSTGLAPLFYIAMVILLVVFLALMTKSSWASVGLILVGLGFILGKRILKTEYEYIFVTNELSVDRIYGQETRKTVRRIEMGKIESVDPTEPNRNKTALENKGVKLLDYSSGEKDARTYTVSFTDKDGRFLMLIEPNEKLLHAMWRCSPGKVHIRK